MAGLIDQAVAHFSSREIRSTNVPEWETTVYAKNMSLDGKARLAKRSDGDTYEYLVYACIFGLTDEQGEAVFTLEDKVKLKTSVDPDIVIRLGNFALGIQGDDEEEREKN
jgi:hypothetical protein